ncbi:hypothetical protein PsYK624_005540 [Phanerochaete sordida]|uniref:Uncharacterized protein n=1 Tax=Phanerochaete sordida TaxID=48140 RepID=A0A9P3L7Z8_9APHY|nr:hypothetical protein PsYK624_005540 [Phanerochaete sordida]
MRRAAFSLLQLARRARIRTEHGQSHSGGGAAPPTSRPGASVAVNLAAREARGSDRRNSERKRGGSGPTRFRTRRDGASLVIRATARRRVPRQRSDGATARFWSALRRPHTACTQHAVDSRMAPAAMAWHFAGRSKLRLRYFGDVACADEARRQVVQRILAQVLCTSAQRSLCRHTPLLQDLREELHSRHGMVRPLDARAELQRVESGFQFGTHVFRCHST